MIPVNTPCLNGNEKKYLNECIDTGWISSEGPFVKEFEEKFAKKTARKFGIAVSNGSAALDVAVLALGIGKGDEVIIPTFTIISCATAIVRAGAIPVLVDSDPVTWNMDVSEIEKKITSRTRAIMVVHIYGLPVNMDPVLAVSKKYGLKIIEDAAEMHGQTYKGKPCGSFGDISTFSLYANKHITCGEGGLVVTDDETLANKCRMLRNLCFIPEKRFMHYELGYNFRLTNIQAALGLAQLEQLNKFVAQKRKMGRRYNELLEPIKGKLQLPLAQTEYAENIYWVYAIVSGNEKVTAKIVDELGRMNIGTRPFFWCMHEQPVFQKMGLFNGESYPVSEKIAREGFYIPSGLGLKDEEIEVVANELVRIVKEIG